MAASSSGSWAGGGAPPNIIDLDKFMRGGVRPSRPDGVNIRCDQLVVDAGGVNRKAVTSRGSPLQSAKQPLARDTYSSSSSERPKYSKRYSHDSGLSDSSYNKKKHRNRRTRGSGEKVRTARDTSAAGGGGTGRRSSCDSMRAFRTVCERALLAQQQQIAKVAQLCERLTERPPPPAPQPAPRPRERQDSPDTSDVSSSSRSTRDSRRKDKHRTEECKTYKIIMNKLDELNRLFAARQVPVRPPPLREPSSGSVSVSDKFVATDSVRSQLPLPVRASTERSGRSVAGSPTSVRSRREAFSVATVLVGGTGTRGRALGRHAVTNACALDIAPSEARPVYHRRNIATESVVQGDSCSTRVGMIGDPRCNFDLDDPVHLYSQAKRLQAMPATMRRARSVESGLCTASGRSSFGKESPTLCAICCRYWRAVTRYITTQVFCYPEGNH